MKSRQYGLMALILIIFFVVVGCGKDEGGGGGAPASETKPANFSEYYPLTKGTFRTYQITEPGAETTTLTQAWTSGATHSGQASVRTCESPLEWEDQTHVGGQTLSFAFSVGEDGLVTLDKPFVIGIDNWQPGQTVSTTGSLSLGGFSFPVTTSVTFRRIESVSVPAGVFSDSMRVDFSLSIGDEEVSAGTEWYAREVGLVKSIDSDGETWELTTHGTLPSPPPALLNIEPPAGNVNGKNLVGLTGRDFQSGASVTIGERLAASVGVLDSTSIMVVTPPGKSGPNSVAVVNPDCQVALIDKGFKFEDGTIPPPQVATWKTEVVDDPKFFKDFFPRAIALDHSGRPHIAYGGDHLYHAYHNGNNWQYETVDDSPKVGRYASIAFDSSGNAHISYLDESRNKIKYATNVSGKWVIETINPGVLEVLEGYASIAIDSSGTPHISYRTTLTINYASKTSGQWEVKMVDDSTVNLGGPTGKNTSIAIDPSGHAHISYFFDGDSSLKHATNASGAWMTETVDDDFNAFSGEYNAIAIDSLGKVHISYYYVDFETHIAEVRHATNAPGVWVAESVFSGGESGSSIISTSIALDSSNHVHMLISRLF